MGTTNRLMQYVTEHCPVKQIIGTKSHCSIPAAHALLYLKEHEKYILLFFSGTAYSAP